MANAINILKPSVCFEVQKIVGISAGSRNSKIYQVEWAPSWISGFHLVGCEDLIEQFENEQNSRELVIKVETADEYVMQDGSGEVLDDKNNDDVMEDANQPDDSPEQQLIDNHSNVEVSLPVADTNLDIHHVGHPYTYPKYENYSGGTNVKAVPPDSSVQSIDHDNNSVQLHSHKISNPGLEYSQTHFTSIHNSGSTKDECMLLSFPCDELISDGSKDCVDSMNINTVSATSLSNELGLTNGHKLPQPVPYFNKEDTIHIVANEPVRRNKSTKVNSKKKALICHVCYKTFTSTYKWKIHFKIHHGDKGVYECKGSSERFSENNNQLQANLYTHSAKAHEYKCSLCKKTFRDNWDLKRHLRVHTGERPFECNVCQKKFKTEHYVKRHLETQHPQERMSLHV